jgi:hypothetical protein
MNYFLCFLIENRKLFQQNLKGTKTIALSLVDCSTKQYTIVRYFFYIENREQKSSRLNFLLLV